MRPRGAGLGRSRLLVGLAATIILGVVPAPSADEDAVGTMPVPLAPKTVAELYAEFAPAVVQVRLIGEEFNAEDQGTDEKPKPIEWISTGFIINPAGRVLCGLLGSTKIARAVVEKDGLEYAAQFLGGDLRTRLALVQLLKVPEKFAVIPLDHEAGQPAIGTPIVAISHPFQLEVGPSAGLIIGYESAYAQNIFPCTYMRTNIALGDAEAGAPTLDMQGNLIGVLTNGVAEFRASYAVTLHSIRRVVNDLNTPPGRVNYGTLPVEFDETPDKPYVARQVVIVKVQPDSQAERAGLRPGDVLRRLTLVTDRTVDLPPSLTALGDGPIRRISHVRDMLFHALPGEFMRIEVERDGQAIPFFTLAVEASKESESSDEPTPAAPAPPPSKPSTPNPTGAEAEIRLPKLN